MTKQNYELKSERIRSTFENLKRENPESFQRRLSLSWSNWGFGIERLDKSASRLQKAGIEFIELHGNHYGADLGYRKGETREILRDYGISVAGVCGMFSPDNDLSSNRAVQRQAAIDYIKREVEFTADMGGSYLLVVPGAVGRPTKYDEVEFERSADTIRSVAEEFVNNEVYAAIEPIRAAEVSFCHTIENAKEYIEAVSHPGVRHLNGDVYHMQSEEAHIGEAILEAGKQLLNLHLADSNRGALGDGSMDLDTIIRALYIIGFNRAGCYVTPEPLGPGGDPYPAMYGRSNSQHLDKLVTTSASYFRAREEALLA